MKNKQAFGILIFGILVMAASAKADSQIVLNQGQCAQVDGRNYCWFYRPSVWDHPDQPARPCDFRKDCPLTLLIPTTANSPNMMTGQMVQTLNGQQVTNQQWTPAPPTGYGNAPGANPMIGAPAQLPPGVGVQQVPNQAQTPGMESMFFCREVEKDKFSLVKVIVNDKTGEKKEIVVNTYGDDDSRCKKDEAKYSMGANGAQIPGSSYVNTTGGPVIIDTYEGPNYNPCPTVYTQDVHTVKAKDIWKSFKKIF